MPHFIRFRCGFLYLIRVVKRQKLTKKDVKRRVVRCCRVLWSHSRLFRQCSNFFYQNAQNAQKARAKIKSPSFPSGRSLSHLSINSIFYTGNQTFLLFKYKVYIKHIVYENVIFVILDVKWFIFIFYNDYTFPIVLISIFKVDEYNLISQNY